MILLPFDIFMFSLLLNFQGIIISLKNEVGPSHPPSIDKGKSSSNNVKSIPLRFELELLRNYLCMKILSDMTPVIQGCLVHYTPLLC